MSGIFTPSIPNVPKVGTPRVVLGTLYINLNVVDGRGIPSSVVVPPPAVGHIYLGGFGTPNDQHAFGIPSFYPTSQVNETHTQIEFHLPQFIQDEHREFISFMKEYYRHSESVNGPLHFLRRLLIVQDIDRTVNELLEYFYREYAPTFPRSVSLSPAIIIKNIRQFYQAKGSEKSFRFLFRVLFDQEIEFYYPRLDILRFSDAKWIQYRTLKCVLLTGTASQLIGNRIIGKTSRASAFVEKVLLIQDGSITSYELFLNRSSVTGEFQADEIIRDEKDTSALRIMPMISKIQITEKGSGYKVGQDVPVLGEGFNCKAKITSVGNIGEVESVEVYQLGGGYRPNTTTASFPLYQGVTVQATGRVLFNPITKYPGYFLNSDGMFSSLKRIQDSYYYQQFSYVIRSEESRDKYEGFVKNIVHPAGYIFFSEVFSESKLDASAEIPAAPDGSISSPTEIFTDLRLDYNEFDKSASEYVFSDASADPNSQADVEIFAEDVTYSSDSAPLGPTWESWDKWKMDYRPTPVFGKPDDQIIQPAHIKTVIKVPHPVTGLLVDKTVIQTETTDYYALNANTPLKTIANVLLKVISKEMDVATDYLAKNSSNVSFDSITSEITCLTTLLQFAVEPGDILEVRGASHSANNRSWVVLSSQRTATSVKIKVYSPYDPEHHNVQYNIVTEAAGASVSLLRTHFKHELASLSDLPEAAVEQFPTHIYANQSLFPSSGTKKRLYIDSSTNKTYMWSDIGPSPAYFELP